MDNFTNLVLSERCDNTIDRFVTALYGMHYPVNLKTGFLSIASGPQISNEKLIGF